VDYAIYLISVEGTVLTWNAGAERLKGYRTEEILGKPFATFFTPEDQSADVPGKALAAALGLGGSKVKAGASAKMEVASGRLGSLMPSATTMAAS
jgi:PAS domain S-box-containing protein